MVCCTMMTGHCASFDVPAGGTWIECGASWNANSFGQPGDKVLLGQTFEADPPPPRA